MHRAARRHGRRAGLWSEPMRKNQALINHFGIAVSCGWLAVFVAALGIVGGCGGVVVPPVDNPPVDGDPDDDPPDDNPPDDGPSDNIPPPGSDVEDGNRDESLTSPSGKTSGEPNDSFQEPIVAVFDSSGAAYLQGTVTIVGDMDIFFLGTFSSGDLVIMDTDTTAVGSDLDISVAVFDSAERLVFNNDDRTVRDLDSYVDWTVRTTDTYYLVATHSAFAPTGCYTGAYVIDITVTPDTEVPEPAEQILMLDFNGGEINSPTLGSLTIYPFEAAAISPVYRGQDDVIKEGIRDTVEQNYERFNVTVITSDDPSPAPGVEYSTVYFGGFNATAFGIAEDVDLYNVDFCDDAIIYTESFDPSVFSVTPTASKLAIAIGNIATHEAGHLLGLNHVDDDNAIMDDQSPADAFLGDQEFMEAPLSSDIMAIGTQDAVMLLDLIVGISP